MPCLDIYHTLLFRISQTGHSGSLSIPPHPILFKKQCQNTTVFLMIPLLYTPGDSFAYSIKLFVLCHLKFCLVQLVQHSASNIKSDAL